jgi:hypothetical protein
MKSLTTMTKTLLLTATMTAILSVSALAQQEVSPDFFETPPAAAPAQQQPNKAATVKKANDQQAAQKKHSKRTVNTAKAGENQPVQTAVLTKITY